MLRVAAAALSLTIMAATAWADVIPTRHADDGAAPARDAVAGRLEKLGLPSADARAHARAISDEEAAYFAADPCRLQFAGQAEAADDAQVSSGEKMVWGAVFLGAILATVTVVSLNQ